MNSQKLIQLGFDMTNSWDTPSTENQTYYGEPCWGRTEVYRKPGSEMEYRVYVDSNGVEWPAELYSGPVSQPDPQADMLALIGLSEKLHEDRQALMKRHESGELGLDEFYELHHELNRKFDEDIRPYKERYPEEPDYDNMAQAHDDGCYWADNQH